METFVGDTTTIVLNTYTNISGFAILRMKYEKPDGTTGFWTATICPADNTCMRYQCSTIDLDVAGSWRIQAYVIGGGNIYHGYWADFKVYSPLM